MDIKPIETVYNGYRFRSRLEARWAVFFDATGIPYEYEPEGFNTESGKKYLPDFYLPDNDIYVEVKPERPGADEEIKDAIIVMAHNNKKLVVLREIPYDNECNVWWFPIYYRHPISEMVEGCRITILDGGLDENNPYASYVETGFWCGTTATLKFPLAKGCISDCKAINDRDLYPRKHPFACFTRDAFSSENVGRALAFARQARFEHGETPKVRG